MRKMYKTPIKDIIIPERQRTDLGDLSGLKESIKTYGLINPIMVDSKMNLIAGHRRLQAHIELGETEIYAMCDQERTEVDKQIMELDENILRKDMTWQEEAIALYRIHRLRKAEPDWSMRKMQQCYGYSIGHLSQVMDIVEQLMACRGQKTREALNLWGATSIWDACRVLIEQRELEARRAVEELNATTKHPLLAAESNVHVMNNTEDKEPIVEKPIEIAVFDKGFTPEGLYDISCVLATDALELGFEQSTKPMIVWLSSIGSWWEEKEKYKASPFPLIWNRINGWTWKDEPFCLSYWLGLYIPNGYTPPPDSPKLPAVINCTVPKDQMTLPVQVVQYSLDAMCADGALVLLPGDNAPVVQVAQCGRVPVWNGSLESNKGKRVELEAYYKTTHSKPIFI